MRIEIFVILVYTNNRNRETPTTHNGRQKVSKTMIIALVEYVNRYGKISMKSFTDEKDLAAFVKKLESKGTEHLVTRCD